MELFSSKFVGLGLGKNPSEPLYPSMQALPKKSKLEHILS